MIRETFMDKENTNMAEEVKAFCVTCFIILIILFLIFCAICWFPGWLCEHIETDHIPHVASLTVPSVIQSERLSISGENASDPL